MAHLKKLKNKLFFKLGHFCLFEAVDCTFWNRPICGFKRQTYGVGIDHSTNWVTTTVHLRQFLVCCRSRWSCDERSDVIPIVSALKGNLVVSSIKPQKWNKPENTHFLNWFVNRLVLFSFRPRVSHTEVRKSKKPSSGYYTLCVFSTARVFASIFFWGGGVWAFMFTCFFSS